MLVERDGDLETLLSALPTGGPDDGRVVLVGGEAGVGKTSLVRALLDTGPAVRVRRGQCDNVTTAAALGPVAEALPELEAALEGATAGDRRRLFRDALALLGEAPTLLVLEDVHWADEATVHLLRYVSRRVAGLPLAVVVTFRDDHARSTGTLTVLLGELASLPTVRRVQLSRLSPSAVADLVEAAGADVSPESLHRRTGGNPFFVTEVLATTGSARLPATVRDAVLARVAPLSDDARGVLGAAAVLGPPADLALVTAVAGRPGAAVDECVAQGVLVVDPDTGGLGFRHEMARETVEASLPPAERSRLHAAALAALTTGHSRDRRRLAHHAEGCGDREAALRHGLAAAERSARLGAHREAVQLYERALRFADLLPGAAEVADLQERLGYECYLTDRIPEALEVQHVALRLRTDAGDAPGVGRAERWLSRLSWFAGNGDDARRYADRAVATLEPLGPGRELAMALSNVSQLAMLEGAEREAVSWGRRAVDLARTLGDRAVESHALNNIGTAELGGHNEVDGLARLEHSLDIALADDLHEHAARAYTNLGASFAALHRFREADVRLSRGIDYCAERDLDSWRHYMSGWRARSQLEQGRYVAAEASAGDVLRGPSATSVARIPALLVSGLLAARRGERDTADRMLDEADRLARETAEAQRIVPTAVARAEAAWLAGAPERIADEIAVALGLPAAGLDDWQRGEVAWWLHLAGARTPDGVVAEPFRLMLADDLVAAGAAWEAIDSLPWSALSRALAPSLEDARTGLADLGSLGSVAVQEAVLRSRHAAGLPVPRAPRAAARANPAGLTTRELEVLGLLTEGLTNAELAARLFLSEKTVDHHVSAVLRKLGEPNRARAVAAAHRRGLVDPNLGRSPDVPGGPSAV